MVICTHNYVITGSKHGPSGCRTTADYCRLLSVNWKPEPPTPQAECNNLGLICYDYFILHMFLNSIYFAVIPAGFGLERMQKYHIMCRPLPMNRQNLPGELKGRQAYDTQVQANQGLSIKHHLAKNVVKINWGLVFGDRSSSYHVMSGLTYIDCAITFVLTLLHQTFFHSVS